MRRTLLLWVALELVAAAQVPADGGSLLWAWLQRVGRPVSVTAEWISRTAADAGSGVVSTTRLVAQSRRLRVDLEASRGRVELLEEDLVAFRQAARLPVLGGGMAERAVAARCTFRNLAAGRMEILAGRGAGIRPETVVVAPDGIAGRVVRVEQERSWVELITHPAAAVAVTTGDGSLQGLAVGTGSRSLRVEFVPRQASLLRGAILETSGADGVYPPGLAVARVIFVREVDDPFLEVRATPTADLADLRIAMLLPALASTGSAGSAP